MTAPLTPGHVAIIMDGNNRWAKLHGKRTACGHAAGADALRRVIRRCIERGIHTLSVLHFRPKIGTDQNLKWMALMRLFEKSLNDEIPELD